MITLFILIFSMQADAARYFAQVDAGVVKNVIRADNPEFLKKLPGEWVETSKDGSIGKNYAMIDGEYHKDINAFLSKKPFPSWRLDKDKKEWAPPIGKEKPPKEEKSVFEWDEQTQGWKKINTRD
jgi:hypothetical protein